MDAGPCFGCSGLVGLVLGALHTRCERKKRTVQRSYRVIPQPIQIARGGRGEGKIVLHHNGCSGVISIDVMAILNGPVCLSTR